MNRYRSMALIAGVAALALSACATGDAGRQRLARDLRTALAGEPVDVAVESDAVRVTSGADRMYPAGGYQLAPGAPVLSAMAPVLARLQRTNIMIRGYTDNTPVGPALRQTGITDNTVLSTRRAETAAAQLRSRGVNPNLLSTQGFGEANPVASNDTAAGRARNRRIEMVLVGDGT